MTSPVRIVAVTIASLAVVHCGGPPTPDELTQARYAARSVALADVTSSMVVVLTRPLDPATDLRDGLAAARSSARAVDLFSPPGCATVHPSGNVAIFLFDGCTGPGLLRRVSGSVRARFTPQSDGTMQVEISGNGIQIDQQTLQLVTSARLDTSLQQNLRLQTSTSSMTTSDPLDHSGSLTASWQDGCLSLSGSFTTTVAGIPWTTELQRYRHCSGRCPDPGGSVRISNENVTVRIDFDGTSRPIATTSTGHTGPIDVACAIGN